MNHQTLYPLLYSYYMLHQQAMVHDASLLASRASNGNGGDSADAFSGQDIVSMSLIPELILSTLLQSQCNLLQPPIHHTLENAIISYDTGDHQKQLVKDVFFSPAMHEMPMLMMDDESQVTDGESIISTASSSSCIHIAQEGDNPSDLLLDQHDDLLFSGDLDLDLHRRKRKRSPDEDHMTTLCKKKQVMATPPMSPAYQRWDDAFDTASSEDEDEDDASDAYSTVSRVPPSHGNSSSSSSSFIEQVAQFQEQQDSGDDDDDEDSELRWGARDADAKTNAKRGRKRGRRSSKKAKKLPTRKPSTSRTSNATNKPVVAAAMPIPASTPAATPIAPSESYDHVEQVPPRATATPSIYQKLTKANMDWCRYCGTTEGVNWRPGPWGKRTLCNKHGCDYKGYGFACKLPRLDLTGYAHESLHDRDRPVLQFYCAGCHKSESWATNVLVRCEGCYRAYHQACYAGNAQPLDDAFVSGSEPWFCDASCRDNVKHKRIIVELSRKRLPLMCAPSKNHAAAPTGIPTRSSILADRSVRAHRATSK